jgi:hypothetical protein
VITKEYVTLCETKETGEEHALDERESGDKSILEYKGYLLAKLVVVHIGTQPFPKMLRQTFVTVWTEP